MEELFNEITKNLKDDNKLENLKNILESYKGDDWKQYVKYDNENYHRKLVWRNDIIDLFIISWHINQESKIHNHPESGCLLKCLEGELNEELYINENDTVKYLKTNIILKENVGYKVGNKILHKIKSSNLSVSLHIYSPPKFNTVYYKN